MSEFLAAISGLVISGPTIAFFVILLTFSLLMFVLTWKTGKSFSLAIGPFKLQLGGKKSAIMSAAEREQLINVVKNIVIEKCDNITEIRNIEILVRQMKYADEKIVEIKSLVTNRFAKQLQDKIPNAENAKSHRDYRSYQIMIGLLANDLKENVLRVSLTDNNILDYSDIEWDDYINQKAELMITMACDFIDFMYDSNNTKIVTLKELSIGNQDIIHTVKEMIRSIFRKAKSISLENQKKIDEIEKEMKDELTLLKGVDEK